MFYPAPMKPETRDSPLTLAPSSAEVRPPSRRRSWFTPGALLTILIFVPLGAAAEQAVDATAAESDGCKETATTLCLLDDRYEVSLAWSKPSADPDQVEEGQGRTARPRTNDSGLFWFFADGNWEMLVKVLDGCSYNGHHWVYAASATTVGLELTVRDTESDAAKTYVKEFGPPAPAITDSGAFGGACSTETAVSGQR